LGAEVYMLGKVGNDSFGKQLIEILSQEDIHDEFIEVSSTKETGTASIAISEQDNRIIVVPGANYEVTPEWVKSRESIIAKSDLLLIQLEIPLQTVIKATEIANKYGIPVILNPAPYQKLPEKLVGSVTFITPNETEFEQLLSDIPIEERDKVVAKCIVTKGEEGVEFHINHEKQTVPAVKVEVVDTTGAGDTFNGALAVAYAKTENLEESILFAVHAASLSVMKMGAQTGMPLIEEIKDKKIHL